MAKRLRWFYLGWIAPLVRLARDAFDILRWTVRPFEVLKALGPSKWLRRIVLNQPGVQPNAVIDPARLVHDMVVLQHLLESRAVIDGRVDYRALGESDEFNALVRRAADLAEVRPEAFSSDAERTAFWINLYNVLCMHGIVALGLRSSAMELPTFFARVAYRIGSWTFTPDDMLNGVLRRGRRRPGGASPQFSADDPRMAFSPALVDPRIHGAVVCVAASCPPVKFYSAEHLDHQLDLATRNLLDATVRANVTRRRIELPLQFHYYAADFGRPLQMREFVLQYLSPERRDQLQQAFDESWPIRFQRYDWALNHPTPSSKELSPCRRPSRLSLRRLKKCCSSGSVPCRDVGCEAD